MSAVVIIAANAVYLAAQSLEDARRALSARHDDAALEALHKAIEDATRARDVIRGW